MRYFVLTILLCFILVGEGSFVANQYKTSSNDMQHSGVVDSEQSDELSTLGQINSQTMANAFRHLKQQNPEYTLLVEFFAEDWSAALYKHLIDSGESEPWYVNCSLSPKRQRISGWKDSNLLHKKGFFQAA